MAKVIGAAMEKAVMMRRAIGGTQERAATTIKATGVVPVRVATIPKAIGAILVRAAMTPRDTITPAGPPIPLLPAAEQNDILMPRRTYEVRDAYNARIGGERHVEVDFGPEDYLVGTWRLQ